MTSGVISGNWNKDNPTSFLPAITKPTRKINGDHPVNGHSDFRSTPKNSRNKQHRLPIRDRPRMTRDREPHVADKSHQVDKFSGKNIRKADSFEIRGETSPASQLPKPKPSPRKAGSQTRILDRNNDAYREYPIPRTVNHSTKANLSSGQGLSDDKIQKWKQNEKDTHIIARTKLSSPYRASQHQITDRDIKHRDPSFSSYCPDTKRRSLVSGEQHKMSGNRHLDQAHQIGGEDVRTRGQGLKEKATPRSAIRPWKSSFTSLEQLARYRGTVLVYLGQGWKSSRKERFYSTLEEVQVKQWKEKRRMAVRHQANLRESRERQLEQLRYIRDKHESIRNRRLNSQHVKWKYAISGKEGDRKSYGLPSEYYTYYGFFPDDDDDADSSERDTRKRSQTASGKYLSSQMIKEKSDLLRKRNEERFNYLFATKRSTHLEMIKTMIRNGLYTVETGEGFPVAANENASQSYKFSRRGKPHLIAKHVIDEAKKTLLDHCDESVSEYGVEDECNNSDE